MLNQPFPEITDYMVNLVRPGYRLKALTDVFGIFVSSLKQKTEYNIKLQIFFSIQNLPGIFTITTQV